MNYLLDTDICVHWLRANAAVHAHVTAVGPHALAVSIITLAELRYGASCSARPDENHQAIDDFTGGLTVLDITPEIARRFGKIKAFLRATGNLIEDFDLLLAASALTHSLTLVTNNTSHFQRIPDLNLQNWTSPPIHV